MLALVALVVAPAGARASGPLAPAARTPSTRCTGEPIRLASITSTSDPDLPAGLRAAVKAVNTTCALGRPFELVMCDDHDDTGAASDCANKAVTAGVLAEVITSFSTVGDASQEILTRNGIPVYANAGFGAVQSTSPLSFPIDSQLVGVAGAASTARALGATSLVLALSDVPGAMFLNNFVKARSAGAGVAVGDPVPIPTGATDWSQVAAQIVSRHTDAIGLPVGGDQLEPILRALIDQGVDFDTTKVIIPSAAMSDRLLESLGKDLDGVYLVGTTARTSDTKNPGIAQYRTEMRSAHEHRLGELGLQAWAGIHELVDILKSMPTIDRGSLVAKLQTWKVERPELAPVDWTTPAFPDDPILRSTRTFLRQIRVSKVLHGKANPVSRGYVDIASDFTLDG